MVHYSLKRRAPVFLLLVCFLGALLAQAINSNPLSAGASESSLAATPTATPVQYLSGVYDIVVSPDFAEDQSVFAGTWDGLFRSTDAGQSWYSTGLWKIVTVVAISPDYAFDGTLLAGAFDVLGGMYRSTDGGVHWQRAAEGLSDPEVTDIAFSSDYVDSGKAFASTMHNGFYETADRGDDWTKRNTGLPYGVALISLALSPESPTDNTYFLGSTGYGVLKYTGLQWFLINTGISDPSRRPVYDLAISPCFPTDGIVYAAMEGRVYRSYTGGDDWHAITNEGVWGHFVEISPDYCTDRVLFAELNGRLQKSTNRGDSWFDVQGNIPGSVKAVGLSPDFAADGTAFAAFDDGIYKTTDGGATWSYAFWPRDPTPTPTATPTPVLTSSPTATATVTATPTPTPTPEMTPSVTPTSTASPCPDGYEPDDTWPLAKVISTDGQAQRRNFDRPGDVDYVKFSAVAGQQYEIWTDNLGGPANDTTITLLGMDGTTVLAFNDDDPYNAPASRISWTCTAAGTYFVAVSEVQPGVEGCDLTYDLSVRVQPQLTPRLYLPVILR